MSSRFLRIVCLCACLAVAGFGAVALAQRPGAPPPGALPPGAAPGGLPPPGMGPGVFGGANGASPPSGAAGANHGIRGGLQVGPAGRWWDDKSVMQTIGLRKDQQKKMDTIFNSNKQAIVSSYKTFLGEKSKLDTLGKDPNVDQTRLFAAIDAVNQARASLQKATSQMLLQIRQQMDPNQIEKLEKLH